MIPLYQTCISHVHYPSTCISHVHYPCTCTSHVHYPSTCIITCPLFHSCRHTQPPPCHPTPAIPVTCRPIALNLPPVHRHADGGCIGRPRVAHWRCQPAEQGDQELAHSGPGGCRRMCPRCTCALYIARTNMHHAHTAIRIFTCTEHPQV